MALGECLSGTGNLQEARERLEAVTRAVPNSLEAHRELLSVYKRLHLGPEAARERATVSRLEREAAAMEICLWVHAVDRCLTQRQERAVTFFSLASQSSFFRRQNSR